MVALVNLPYPFATFIPNKAQKIPRKNVVRSSIRVPSPSLRRTRRKNYLRRKILRTLAKPYNVPLDDSVVVPLEIIEKLDSSFVEESKVMFGSHDSDLREVEVVRGLEERNSVGFDGFSGRMIVRIVGSFVGLFILQTIVSVWIMGSGSSSEKDEDLGVGDKTRDLRLAMEEEKVGINGNSFPRNWANMEVVESEMIAKINEIRKMASEVREAEKKKKVENGEEELDNVSDSEEDDEMVDSKTDSSRFNSGILKEVDGRLSRLRKSRSLPSLKVNIESKSEGKDKSLDGKEDDNMLMFKVKPKFRSDLSSPKEKPKGFQGRDGVRKRKGTMSDDEFGERTSVPDNTFPQKNNSAIDEEKKTLEEQNSLSQSLTPLKGSRKNSGRNTEERRLEKGINGSKLESIESTRKLSKETNEIVKLDSSNANIVDAGVGAKKSNTIATQDKRKMDYIDPKKLSTVKDAQQNVNPWWSRLPYVLVILMQKGIGSEAHRGFYNFRVYNDGKNQSYCSYTVGFEEQNDAKNLSYLLELEFEDQPDFAVQVAPLSTKDFREVVESLESEVIVVRKGELKLYAGQPLAEVEDALRSLVNQT